MQAEKSFLGEEKMKNSFEGLSLEEMEEKFAERVSSLKSLKEEWLPIYEKWMEEKKEAEVLKTLIREQRKKLYIVENGVTVYPSKCKNPVEWKEEKEKAERLFAEMMEAGAAGDSVKARELMVEYTEMTSRKRRK